MKILDWIHGLFVREVDLILTPLNTAIRRVENLGASLRKEEIALEQRASWVKDEAAKAERVVTNLKNLLK